MVSILSLLLNRFLWGTWYIPTNTYRIQGNIHEEFIFQNFIFIMENMRLAECTSCHSFQAISVKSEETN